MTARFTLAQSAITGCTFQSKQIGSHDLDILFGSWPVANQNMAAALAYQGYDYQFVFGEGGHSAKHGATIFPDTMRWLWRDWPKRANF